MPRGEMVLGGCGCWWPWGGQCTRDPLQRAVVEVPRVTEADPPAFLTCDVDGETSWAMLVAPCPVG